MLRPLLLRIDDNAARNMSDTDCRFGLVDMLTAGALRAHGIDLEILFIDGNVDVLDFRQYGDSGGRGMDATGCLRVGYALDAVDTRFELQLGEHAAAAHLRDDLFETALGPLAQRKYFDLPALNSRVALIHAEKIACEKRGFVSSGPCTDFQDGIVIVHRVLRQKGKPYLFLEVFAARRKRDFFGFREPAH